MIATESLLRCRYCKKPAVLPEEVERAHTMPGGKRVTVCNPCGGYENCIRCGKVWENIYHDTGSRECYECEDKEAVRNLMTERGITEAQAWKLIGGKR